MKETSLEEIKKILETQKGFFKSHRTRGIEFRKLQLQKLKTSIKANEKLIYQALWEDLHKSEQESFFTELSLVYNEIDWHLKNLSEWLRPRPVSGPFSLFPSSFEIKAEPLGLALIVVPFNYPVLLLFNPLIGAISSGCCAIVKPSPNANSTARLIGNIIEKTFSQEYVAVVQGSKPTNELLFAQRFDIIFFTGSTALGKIVMRAAAEYLTPVILELGGKSPCIVDAGIDLELAAKRIVWGKYMNAGQTCIAPDYVLVRDDLKDDLMQYMLKAIKKFFGDNPKSSPHYARIVSVESFDRLMKMLAEKKLFYGGEHDRSERYIQPVLLDDVLVTDDLMLEEIFGPILPILKYKQIEDAISFVNAREKPLALYVFGSNKISKKVLDETSAGGVCVNDTLLQIANHHLPFGGVGASGMGRYHGKESFLAFSHEKTIVRSSRYFDLKFKYAPYHFFRWLKKIV